MRDRREEGGFVTVFVVSLCGVSLQTKKIPNLGEEIMAAKIATKKKKRGFLEAEREHN